jgi:hypothetical protein|tara:strand:+ start:18845 stop:19069 length:225 start_codon:yes stop_codon:yes gene_type:complete
MTPVVRKQGGNWAAYLPGLVTTGLVIITTLAAIFLSYGGLTARLTAIDLKVDGVERRVERIEDVLIKAPVKKER